MSAMLANGWVCFDTETTGFDGAARVLEVGVVAFDRGEPVREWSQLLWPGELDWESSAVKGALAVNQIRREELVGMPTFVEVLPRLLLELSHDIWVAHNASFDVRMLQQEMTRAGHTMAMPKVVACTCKLAQALGKGAPGNKLGEVATRYKVSQEGAHRASVDARVCGQILQAMLRAGHLPADDDAFLALLERAGRRRR